MEKQTVSIQYRSPNRSDLGITVRREPFRLFFLMAAIDAMLGAAAWLPVAFTTETLSVGAPGVWHRNALLFGTIPAVLAGFLLTALPRWTKQPAASRSTMRFLAATWVAARVSSFLFATVGLALAAVFVLSLTIVAARPVIASRDRRNVKVVLLLSCFCASIVAMAGAWHVELALRIAIASIIGLVTIIGGRIVPALTAAYTRQTGGRRLIRLSTQVERAAAIATTCALAAWAIAPQAWLTGAACAAAAVCQLLRVAQWRGWQGRVPWSIIALHVGYCWTVAGFMLLALHVFFPETVGRGAGIHAWTIGAFGMMGLAIMASMIRKHSGHPFSDSIPATAAFVAIMLSCLSRLVVETPVDDGGLWLRISAGLWIAAFGLFLVAFGGYLLGRE
ncbi:MAG: NnrS family protein [Mesorhizobium sp.]|nr:NnrS family protein [Mesorhizobium sp.]